MDAASDRSEAEQAADVPAAPSPPPPTPWPRALAVGLATAVLAGAWLFGFDRAFAALLDEASAGLPVAVALTLLGGHVLAAALLIGAGGLAALGARGARRLHASLGGPWTLSLLAALLALPPGFALGAELASGAWIARQPIAPVLRFGLPLVLAAGTFGAVRVWALFCRRWRFVGLPLFALASAGVAGADALVMPGLYEEAHVALYAVAALLSVLAAGLALRPLTARRAALLGPVGAVSGLLIAGSATSWALLDGGTQAALALRSPAAANALALLPSRSVGVLDRELAAFESGVEPPEPALPPRPAGRPLLGRDDWNVVFIVVDTLRADALPPLRGKGSRFAGPKDTPFLDQWLAKTWRFRFGYSQATRTRSSMPPTFRSLEAHEDTRRLGSSLADEMAALGRRPVAVVPQYFLMPESEDAQRLLEGFERVEFYQKDRQQDVIPRAEEVFAEVKDRPFFAWIHFYCLHDPGFDGRMLSSAAGKPHERYRRSLRWLDGRLKALFAELDRLGLSERTLVVFTSDHGENLGDNRLTGHGATVFEEEVRVPIALRIPGTPGGELTLPVGNVDLVPTLVDALGGGTRPYHVGRSLLPLFEPNGRLEPRALYMTNGNERVHGVVLGRDKLVYDQRRGVFHRFDLEADPKEIRDLFDAGSERDLRLMRLLLYRHPGLFEKELRSDDARGRLRQRLEAAGPGTPSPALDLMLRLTAIAPEPALLDAAERLLQGAPSDLQLRVLRHLFDADPSRWSNALEARLAALTGRPEEVAWVNGLAAQGQTVFAPERVAARLQAAASGPPDTWSPWLRLVAPWKKSATLFGPALEALLARAADPAAGADRAVLELLLVATANLDGESDLAARVRPFVPHAEPTVEAAAIRALAALRDVAWALQIRDRLADAHTDERVRQAAMHALARLTGKDAVPQIVEAGRAPLLTVDALQILGGLGSPDALPFLREVQRTTRNAYTRRQAQAAIRKVEAAERAAR